MATTQQHVRALVNYWLSTVKKYPVINELTADHVEADNVIFLVLSCANWMSDTAIPRHRNPNSMDPVNDENASFLTHETL
jgi:hypothetical protein